MIHEVVSQLAIGQKTAYMKVICHYFNLFRQISILIISLLMIAAATRIQKVLTNTAFKRLLSLGSLNLDMKLISFPSFAKDLSVR